MRFEISRDGGAWRFRKLQIELFGAEGCSIDRRFMFSFPLFTLARRLERKKRRMLRCAAIMAAAEAVS
jgi:hypothetical protein